MSLSNFLSLLLVLIGGGLFLFSGGCTLILLNNRFSTGIEIFGFLFTYVGFKVFMSGYKSLKRSAEKTANIENSSEPQNKEGTD